MILENNERRELSSKDYNFKEEGKGDAKKRVRIDKRLASLIDRDVFEFRRPKNKLPKSRYNPDGSRTILAGQRNVLIEPFYELVKNGNSVTVRYVERQTRNADGTIRSTTPEYLAFEGLGIMKVDVNRKPELWYWMYNHPRCENGPNWVPGNKPLFELYDPGVEMQEMDNTFEMEYQVMNMLGDITTNEAVLVAQLLNIPLNNDNRASAKALISKRAKVDLKSVFKVLQGSIGQTEEYDMQLYIDDLDKYGIASYHSKNENWVRMNGALPGKKILNAPKTIDTRQAFIDFLQSDEGSKVRGELDVELGLAKERERLSV